MKLKSILLLIFVFLHTHLTNAQCVMCRTQVVNNVSHGDIELAGGLNLGIIYLFSAPYLLITIVFILWYRFFYFSGKKIGLSAVINECFRKWRKGSIFCNSILTVNNSKQENS